MREGLRLEVSVFGMSLGLGVYGVLDVLMDGYGALV